jgi:regulator of RNase E activity RraA
VIGFTIQPIRRRVSPDMIERFRTIPVANASDCMSRLRPGDNLMVHKALDVALPGDVVVVDAGGDLTNSIVGEIMISYAQERGLGGIVINGSIRDSGAIARQKLPVYAAGVTHRGPMRSGPGEIGRTIAIDGMVIEPGDLIIGDADGLLAIPFEQVAEVCVAATAKRDAESKILSDLVAGGSMDRGWVDATLKQLGCTDLN